MGIESVILSRKKLLKPNLDNFPDHRFMWFNYGSKMLGEHHSTLHFLKLSFLFLSNAESLSSMGYSDAPIKAN